MNRKFVAGMYGLLIGCSILFSGGCGKKEPAVDTAPLEKGIAQFLENKHMEMKVLNFKDVKVNGDTATATCSLKHKTLPSPAVWWKFSFKKENGKWVVNGCKM